ncbi:MAG: efflux RND transporter permease subunit, partial [Candidatus Hydrogenedentes bacterium]|nr:efflux RND transporter permease subunit [Candidatus Hydrogenedentota bacterium]
MKITNMAIDRRTTIYVLLVIILVSGIYSWMTLPRESNPEVVVPFIHIAVTYEGVTPEDMESLVTLPLERKLANLKNIKQITSTSVEGVSSVFLEFDADSDVDDSLQRVRDKVDQARNDLPADAEDPVITELNISEFPIMILSLTGELPLPILTEIAEDIEDRIETIKGVLDVKVIGQYEREIQIVVDPVRVVEYGVSMSDLISITRLENVNTPGGSLDLGEGKYLMRTPGEIRSPEELNNLVVKQGAQGTVYLRDIAEVVDGYKETTSISRVNGKPSLTLTISKRAGENIVAVAEQIQDEIERTNASLPAGIALAVTLDESDFVRDMVADLENSILSGLILVCIVIFLFLGLTNAFLVALA